MFNGIRQFHSLVAVSALEISNKVGIQSYHVIPKWGFLEMGDPQSLEETSKSLPLTSSKLRHDSQESPCLPP